MPNALIDGIELIRSVKKMAIKITTTIIAERVSVFLNTFYFKLIRFAWKEIAVILLIFFIQTVKTSIKMLSQLVVINEESLTSVVSN